LAPLAKRRQPGFPYGGRRSGRLLPRLYQSQSSFPQGSQDTIQNKQLLLSYKMHYSFTTEKLGNAIIGNEKQEVDNLVEIIPD